MTRFALLAVVAACGGAGGIVDQDPDVQITAVRCSTSGPDSIDVNIDFGVTLGAGQGFDADVAIVGVPPGTQSTVDDFYACESWSITHIGTMDGGCQRDSGQELSQTPTLIHNESINGTLPTPTIVSITAHVRMSPVSGAAIAQDAMNASCQ